MRTLRQRFVLPAAAVLLAQIVAAPGSAQAPAGPAPSDGDAAQGLTSLMSRNRLDSVLGREVRTRVEEDVGRIVDILADRQSRVQAVVIEFGGFLGIGTRKIAVDWSALSFENDGKRPFAIVDLSRDQLRLAPEYRPNEQPMIVRTSDYKAGDRGNLRPGESASSAGGRCGCRIGRRRMLRARPRFPHGPASVGSTGSHSSSPTSKRASARFYRST